MKTEHIKWLSISLFVSKNKRHILINTIKSFILQLYKNETLFALRFAFNNESGGNIRLSLQVPAKKKHDVALLLDEYFKSFFKTNKLFPAENDNSNIGVFMPYFNNTVAYGLYTVQVDLEYRYVSTLEDALSQIILEAFADDLIDEEMILTLALYVLFSCYKTLRENPIAEGKWRAYYQKITNSLKSTEFNDEFIEENYQPVKETVDEIYSDVLYNTGSNLTWIAKWEYTFNKTWNKIKPDENAMLFFVQVNQMINQQLNLGLDSQFLLSVILNKTIKEQTANTLY